MIGAGSGIAPYLSFLEEEANSCSIDKKKHKQFSDYE